MDFKQQNEREINETEVFKSFSVEIEYLMEFLHSLTELISYNGRIISFFSNKEFYILNTSLLESSVQTLKSIKLCCSIGSFSDANTLIRKLRDDLVQYVYILNITNLRKPFLEEGINAFNTDNQEEFVNSFLNLQFNNTLTMDEEAVTAWFKNTVSDLKGPIKGKLEFKNYMEVLKQNDNITQILTEYNLQNYWETLRKELNNYTHSNGSYYSSQNFISAKDKHLDSHLKNIHLRATYVSSVFLILLLMIQSSLISSTDYIDHIDCDMEPPEGSQYFVASFVQDFINRKVAKIHPELKQYLRDNNIHGMKIE